MTNQRFGYTVARTPARELARKKPAADNPRRGSINGSYIAAPSA
jgi:hypothetical protein